MTLFFISQDTFCITFKIISNAHHPKMKVNKCEGKALYSIYKKMNVNESKCETFDLLNYLKFK